MQGVLRKYGSVVFGQTNLFFLLALSSYISDDDINPEITNLVEIDGAFIKRSLSMNERVPFKSDFH